MPYDKLSEANAAIRGIDPKVTLAQANSIARCADAIDEDEVDSPWAICISSFKESHGVNDAGDGWTKKKEKALGQGQGVGNERQGEGGTSWCICTECKHLAEHERDVPCAETPCPECGSEMRGAKPGEVEAGGKSMWKIDGVEVSEEELVESWKALNVQKEAQAKRAEKYGISVLEDGYITKPSDIPDAQWGDPVNYAYPCPTKEQTLAALHYWGENKSKYSESDQETITVRLNKFAKEFEAGEKSLMDEVKVQEDDEHLIAFGNSVKALGEGRIGEHLVLFGKPDKKDLEGEYFTPDTWYGPTEGNGVDVLVHHGVPLKKGLEGLSGHIFNSMETRRTDLGIWAETVLDMSDEYEKMVYEMAESGALKWSSGSVSRLIRREDDGMITRWPIVEGSLTPIPAEARMKPVMPLKSYIKSFESEEEGSEEGNLEAISASGTD